MDCKHGHAMDNIIRLTGISIVYEGNLIYWCTNQEIIEQFRAYLDSSELRYVGMVYVWFEADNKPYYMKVEPERSDKLKDSWFVTVNNNVSFIFTHAEGENLLDELQFRLRDMRVIPETSKVE
jgi:hypothetical protein